MVSPLDRQLNRKFYGFVRIIFYDFQASTIHIVFTLTFQVAIHFLKFRVAIQCQKRGIRANHKCKPNLARPKTQSFFLFGS
jgi:hypothetical protein